MKGCFGRTDFATGSSEDLENSIEKIKDLISEKLLDQASSQISLLEEETDPNQPVLVRLRAIINRLETLGK